MINQIWRYSHFALAVSSAVFILLATLTGIILALEPIEKKLQSFKIAGSEALPLATLVDSLTSRYDEVLEISVDANDFVAASVISMVDSLNGDFYINPFTGEKIGNIPPKNTFFEFVTNLHRSLFLKSIGRIFVGVTSFLLSLIAITGLLLFIKRQKGIRNLFKRIIKEDAAPYYHVVLGRWILVPILIISISGVYLSLLRFSIIPKGNSQLVRQTDSLLSSPSLPLAQFPLFQETKLASLRKLEFPFSPEVEDFFIMSLADRQVKLNQLTGEVVEERAYPFVKYLSTLNFDLHTGNGSIIWSLVLLISALNILVFMYTGALISYKRLRSKSKNVYTAKDAEIILLVGTENGSTRTFANLLQKALLASKKKVFVDDLNAYQNYPEMQHMVILTSTYGVGDPPVNAGQFLTRLNQLPPSRATQCAVVGFGSYAYPDFCQYALEVEAALKSQENCVLQDAAYLIHNKSYTSFQTWAHNWGDQLNLRLDLAPSLPTVKTKVSHFTVIQKQSIQDGFGDTFLLTLQANGVPFRSGDLLAIEPPEDPVERLYSIAKIQGNQVLLSVKRHEQGVCSNYLNRLGVADKLEAGIQSNKEFHFPERVPSATLISNGTGIAPFLGMIQEKRMHTEVYLYWGGRNSQSYALYEPWIAAALDRKSLDHIAVAYSREESPYAYVQDIVRNIQREIAERLHQGGVIMLCGSIGMQNAVLKLLEEICEKHTGEKLSYYQNRGQILMDCY